MRVPRVRFTVRRMMIAVAILAILMGGLIEVERMRRRRLLLAEYYASLSRAHEWREYRYLNSQLGFQVSARIFKAMISRDSYAEAEAARCRACAEVQGRVAEYEAALKEKYAEAAARPRESVPPDPPAPPGVPGFDPGEDPSAATLAKMARELFPDRP